MNYKKEYLKVNKEIRKLETQKAKAEKSTGTNHILHLLLSIITAGIWIPVWILMAFNFDTRGIGVDGKLSKLYDERDLIELEMRSAA